MRRGAQLDAAILPAETWSTWLGEEPAKPDQLKSLLVPYTGR
jgi:hypothetical protein